MEQGIEITGLLIGDVEPVVYAKGRDESAVILERIIHPRPYGIGV